MRLEVKEKQDMDEPFWRPDGTEREKNSSIQEDLQRVIWIDYLVGIILAYYYYLWIVCLLVKLKKKSKQLKK